MGSGGKGGGGQDWNYVAGQNAYNAAAGGQDLGSMLGGADPAYHGAMTQGFNQFQSEQQPAFEMPEFSFGQPTQWENPYDSMEPQKSAEQVAGESRVSFLYTSKFDAADKATDYVNDLIAENTSYAKLTGAEYLMNEETKSELINQTFSKYWSESNETELSTLSKKWGAQDNVWKSSIKRLEDDGGEAMIAGQMAGEKVPSGQVFGDIEEDDEDLLGGVVQTLGGV